MMKKYIPYILLFGLVLLMGLSTAAAACAEDVGDIPETFIPKTYIEPMPEPTLPVQTDGVITLESRRTFGGDLHYETPYSSIDLKWTAGVAYTDSQDRLGALRHVWVYSEHESEVKVVEQDFAYDLAKDGTSAKLTLTFTVEMASQQKTYTEVFTILPDGEGARVERLTF